MFKFLKLISIAWASLLTFDRSVVSASSAATVSGYIYKATTQNDTHFTVKRGLNYYLLEALNPHHEMVLNRLNSSDFISLSGDYTPIQTDMKDSSYFSMKVFDINYVGLTDLLGYWKDQKGLCYYFSGYTKLVTYLPTYHWPCNNRASRQTSNIKQNTYNYVILPSAKSWVIGLSSNKAHYTMEVISITPSQASFYFYSAETGDFISTIILQR